MLLMKVAVVVVAVVVLAVVQLFEICSSLMNPYHASLLLHDSSSLILPFIYVYNDSYLDATTVKHYSTLRAITGIPYGHLYIFTSYDFHSAHVHYYKIFLFF